MLILTRKCGQSLVINDSIEITITEISGDKVKIGIEAPKEVPILRKELLQTVETNQEAISSVTDHALREFAAKFKRAE